METDLTAAYAQSRELHRSHGRTYYLGVASIHTTQVTVGMLFTGAPQLVPEQDCNQAEMGDPVVP